MNDDAGPRSERPAGEVRELVVPESMAGQRLDKTIVALLPELTRARVKRAIDLGAVRINGRRSPKGAAVAAGDRLRVDVGQVADTPAVASAGAEIRVVFESDQVAVVDKPAGQPTAPLRAAETGTLVNAVLARYPELAAPGGRFVGYSPREPGILHRLDTETSGLVIVARTEASFETLKLALREGRIEKRYLLVCAEQDLPEGGTIEFPLSKHPKDQRRIYPCIHPRDVMRYRPRPAVTRYRVVRRVGIWALVEASVSKALRHQIRAHFAAAGHPLAGDRLYGGPAAGALGRHALHASHVAYGGGEGVAAFEVSLPLAEDMSALLEGANRPPGGADPHGPGGALG